MRECLGGGALGTCQPPQARTEECSLCDEDKDGCNNEGPYEGGGGGASFIAPAEPDEASSFTASATSCSMVVMAKSCSLNGCTGQQYCGESSSQWGPCNASCPPPPPPPPQDPGVQTWKGDFLDRNNEPAPSFTKFAKVDSGGSPSSTGQRTHPCINVGNGFGQCDTYEGTLRPLNSEQGSAFCPAGNDWCRFLVVSPPIGESGSDYMLQVRTAAADTLTISSRQHPRNELERPIETLNGVTRSIILEGDERYYTWQVHVPTDRAAPSEGSAAFPDPISTSGGWHVLFQFHEAGNCSSQAPVMTFGINPIKRVGDTNVTWQWLLKNKQRYTRLDSDPLWKSEYAGGITRGRWYKFVLHVWWSRCNGTTEFPCTAGHQPGLVELWVDRAKVYSGNRVTMYSWPTREQGQALGVYPGVETPQSVECDTCDCQAEYNGKKYCRCEYPLGTEGHQFPEEPMPNFIKTGLYRDVTISQQETIFLKGYAIGTTCAAATGSAADCP